MIANSPDVELEKLRSILKQAEESTRIAREMAVSASQSSVEASRACEAQLQMVIETRKLCAEITAFWDAFRKLCSIVLMLEDLDGVERLLGRTVDEAVKRRSRA